MEFSWSRAAALTAGLMLLAEGAWLVRPARILPTLEPGLGAPPLPGRPDSGDRAARAGLSGATGPGGQDGAESADDWRDAPLDAAPRAPRAAARVRGADGGATAGAPGGLGTTRGGPRSLARAASASQESALSKAGRAEDRAASAARALSAEARAAAQKAARDRAEARRAAASRAEAGTIAREFGRSPAFSEPSRSGAGRGRDAAAGAARGSARRGGSAPAASLFDPSEPETRPRREERERRRRRRESSERRTRAREERGSERRFKPLLMGTALGPKSLRPPANDLQPPTALLDLPERRPASDPEGKPTPAASASLSAVEALNPSSLSKDRHAGAHWDEDQWHDGPARGVEAGGAWLWTYRDGSRTWALAGDPPEPLLRHDGAWWLKSGGMWFVVHDGEPWALRNFSDWGAQGLFHPATGTQIVYSADYSRAAVITPGRGAEVFDARTGALIGTIPEDRMPATRRPRPPQNLPTPQ
jgi:hypothetical protein